MIRVRRNAKGEKLLQIDLLFRRADGTRERYRRNAQVQVREAARAEEQRIIAHFVQHGTLSGTNEPTPRRSPIWSDAVEHYREVKAPSLKSSTSDGYDELLRSAAFAEWGELPVARIDYEFVEAWSAKLGVVVGKSRLRNLNVVLRTVLRSFLGDAAMPRLPKLPKVGRTVVRSASADDVAALLDEVDDLDDGKHHGPFRARQRQAARLAFALAALAGLRASEVRGLRWQDVDLDQHTIVVRSARVVGVEDAPKSGHQREIHIAPELLERLNQAKASRRPQPDDYVAPRSDGKPWGDSGLIQALRSACGRLGIGAGRVHGLRHYFVTQLFAGGVDAITVMDLAGHADLATTQRYADVCQKRKRAAILASFPGSTPVPG